MGSINFLVHFIIGGCHIVDTLNYHGVTNGDALIHTDPFYPDVLGVYRYSCFLLNLYTCLVYLKFVAGITMVRMNLRKLGYNPYSDYSGTATPK